MKSSLWLVGRALFVLALLLGLYLLVIALAAGLFMFGFVLFAATGLQLASVLCTMSGFAIFWSLAPRPDRSTPPGTRLMPEEQPRLFELIAEVASATGQPMPTEVYLAWANT